MPDGAVVPGQPSEEAMTVMTRECRSSTRQTAAHRRARLEWWDGNEFREAHALLVNISDGGALVLAGQRPPMDHPVWCRLEAPTRTDWVRAIVVRHGEGREVGLAFPDACPSDFALAATLGLNFDSLFRRLG